MLYANKSGAGKIFLLRGCPLDNQTLSSCESNAREFSERYENCSGGISEWFIENVNKASVCWYRFESLPQFQGAIIH